MGEFKRLSTQRGAERGAEAAVDDELIAVAKTWRSSGGKSKRTRSGWGFRFSPTSKLRRDHPARSHHRNEHWHVMTEWLQIAINTAQDRWHSRTGLAVALASVAAVFIGAFAGIDITEVLFVEWLIVFAACAVMGIVWWVTRLPRVMPGRIGFGLAIQYEDSQHAKQLRSDFVLTLGDLITSTGDGNLFQFIELPISVARRILSADEATRFAKQCRLHFLLYGRARMRDLPGGASHVIDLRGVVCHAPIKEKMVSETRRGIRGCASKSPSSGGGR